MSNFALFFILIANLYVPILQHIRTWTEDVYYNEPLIILFCFSVCLSRGPQPQGPDADAWCVIGHWTQYVSKSSLLTNPLLVWLHCSLMFVIIKQHRRYIPNVWFYRIKDGLQLLYCRVMGKRPWRRRPSVGVICSSSSSSSRFQRQAPIRLVIVVFGDLQSHAVAVTRLLNLRIKSGVGVGRRIVATGRRLGEACEVEPTSLVGWTAALGRRPLGGSSSVVVEVRVPLKPTRTAARRRVTADDVEIQRLALRRRFHGYRSRTPPLLQLSHGRPPVADRLRPRHGQKPEPIARRRRCLTHPLILMRINQHPTVNAERAVIRVHVLRITAENWSTYVAMFIA